MKPETSRHPGIYFAFLLFIFQRVNDPGYFMKTVDQLVSEWTKEEREKLKELIDECRDREKQSLERAKANDENRKKLGESLQCFLSDLYEIKERAEKVADNLLEIYLRFYRNETASA